MTKQRSFFSRTMALLPISAMLCIAACFNDTVGISGESQLGTSTLGDPRVDASEAPASISQKALSVRDQEEQALIEFQQSDDFRSGGYRCGSREPALTVAAARDASDCSLTRTSIKGEYDPANGPEIVIPVVFHVVSKTNGTGRLAAEFLTSQLDILNEDYGAKPGSPGALGIDARIRFVLADRTPSGQPTNGIEYITNDAYYNDPAPSGVGPDRSPMKTVLNWDPTRYFNIYTNAGGGPDLLGYATFPAESAGLPVDGVVLNQQYVGRNPPQGGIFNMGRTGTHEVGHYLGLFHTFQGQSCSHTGYTSGDLINDTPTEKVPHFECKAGSASQECSGHEAPIWNYMDYTPDSCMNRFTAEQLNRVRCSVAAYRPAFIRGNNPPPENQAPTTTFTSSVAGLTVTFSDSSSDRDGQVTGWQWAFGDDTTSTDRNPSHTYAQDGTYAVTLTVTDNNGATASSQAAITVMTGSADSALRNGQAVTLAGERDGERVFTLEVPAGVSQLRFLMSGGSGDADLYVRFGSRPTASEFDYRPYLDGNNETVTPTSAKAGTWYIMVRAYTAFKDAKLTASFATADSTNGPKTDKSTGTLAVRTSAFYDIAVKGGRVDLNATWDSGADLDLYITDPNGTQVASATSIRRPETLSFDTKGVAGTYRIRVYNFSRSTSAKYTLTATWQSQ